MKHTFYMEAKLTVHQAVVLEEYIKGTPRETVCALLKITSQSYDRNLYTAMYKLLRAAVESGGDAV